MKTTRVIQGVTGPVGQVQARRAKVFPSRPVLGSFVVMLVGVNPAFMAYGLAYTAVTRWSGAATSVVCPWPWPRRRARWG